MMKSIKCQKTWFILLLKIIVVLTYKNSELHKCGNIKIYLNFKWLEKQWRSSRSKQSEMYSSKEGIALPFAYDPQSEAWKFLLNPSKGKSCTVGSWDINSLLLH